MLLHHSHQRFQLLHTQQSPRNIYNFGALRRSKSSMAANHCFWSNTTLNVQATIAGGSLVFFTIHQRLKWQNRVIIPYQLLCLWSQESTSSSSSQKAVRVASAPLHESTKALLQTVQSGQQESMSLEQRGYLRRKGRVCETIRELEPEEGVAAIAWPPLCAANESDSRRPWGHGPCRLATTSTQRGV